MTWCSVHIKYEFLTKQCCHRKIIVGVKMDIPLCQEWCGCYFGYERCINGKNIFEIIDLMGDLNISSEKIFAKIENYKSKIYDINNGELLFFNNI